MPEFSDYVERLQHYEVLKIKCSVCGKIVKRRINIRHKRIILTPPYYCGKSHCYLMAFKKKNPKYYDYKKSLTNPKSLMIITSKTLYKAKKEITKYENDL